ncbi:glycosyl transferase family protein [Erythrobacter sp. SCSIO 43205]|uniref:glycosyl transferase family protein n=1 Tax=Erythrobacter sp. SCSIO 43205 TaxID=2779361 RepID=UPI001CA9C0FE|nr:glycosyl transferase family protein [Erythrobacter sp. SCSIO 43205]UAB79070.1 glycosyl transferase family protein [Erythrobacter sp. SCSIO 43205]
MGSDFWQILAIVQYELLLFAGIFFLIGALDDFAVDVSWLWLKLTGRARTAKVNRRELQHRKLAGPVAVFVPAWQEADVIFETIRHLLTVWPQQNLRLYVGIYRNDPETLEAATSAAMGDDRLRLVIHDRDGPSTKADCLNRLYEAMSDDENRSRVRFGAVLFHDAEDMVDPAGLGLLELAICEGADFAQLPVEPLPQASRDWLGSHYCEEFAEAHGKAMVVRGAVGAGLPSAGVGCGVSRAALFKLADAKLDGLPFEPDSLTEDYELGLAISKHGGTCRFVRARGEDDQLIATRAFFPSKLSEIVRQKTRWVHGISLQGWDRTGWTHGVADTWMRARDRRGPLTALVMALGYLLLVLTLIISVAGHFGELQPLELSPFVVALLSANLAFFAWRVAWRFAFTARNYGVAEGVFAIVRLPITNIIAIMAGRRAVQAYWRTLFGAAPTWDKTRHTAHPVKPIAQQAVSMPPHPAPFPHHLRERVSKTG